MTDVKFSTEERQILVAKIQTYFNNELSEDIGGFDAEFLLDFFNNTIGAYHYNQGLRDAQILIDENNQSLLQRIYEIEKEI
ncbi:hypothetical protein MNB_SV-5-382 [hydrothermal vent metagenome]|uniref:DUF2164 domain-containing protein n=1 Tax=hydrothermal vent metagenome TaxID=652676 RepID=A0A1W1EF86_9ZZZZ